MFDSGPLHRAPRARQMDCSKVHVRSREQGKICAPGFKLFGHESVVFRGNYARHARTEAMLRALTRAQSPQHKFQDEDLMKFMSMLENKQRRTSGGSSGRLEPRKADVILAGSTADCHRVSQFRSCQLVPSVSFPTLAIVEINLPIPRRRDQECIFIRSPLRANSNSRKYCQSYSLRRTTSRHCVYRSIKLTWLRI